jgi:hypothetical protein
MGDKARMRYVPLYGINMPKKPRISLRPPAKMPTVTKAEVKIEKTKKMTPAVASSLPQSSVISFPKVKANGFIDGMPDDIYHGDCCVSPSMSSSMAKLLIEECPKKMWSDSYLDPNREKKENKNFDLGHALHKIFLEPEKFADSIQEIEFDTYQKDEAKRQRYVARERGKVPLLTKDLRTIIRMREALMSDPIARKSFTKGVAERSYFVKDKETGVWLKARPDWEMFTPRILCDYKTTESANPVDFSNSVYNFGYYIQQPWYQHIIKEITGEQIDEWYFIAQEKEYPYLVSIIEIKPEAIEYGQKIMRKAIRKFADCLDKGIWHGYRDPSRPDQDGVITVDLPTRAYFQLAEREERGEFN